MAQDPLLQTNAATTTETTERSDDWMRLLQGKINPSKSEERWALIERAVGEVAIQALANTKLIGEDVFETLDKMRAALDKKLSDQINEIIHHPEFQALESAWRGLHYMVFNTNTGSDLKIKVMNAGKEELRRVFRNFRDAAWMQSPLFKKLYQNGFGTLGGHPYGAMVCDYQFDHSAPDLEVLRGLAKIGAAAHMPIISAASPNLLGMGSWQDLSKPRDLGKIFDAADYAGWRGFRSSQDARYVALTAPRFLGRTTYGAKTDPVDGFDFEEVTDGDHNKHLWLNSAYALGTRITTAFKKYGWCTRIRGVESGGTITNLPTATFPTDDGGVDMKCPTEISIPDTREGELSKAGLMALVHRQNTDHATFIGGQTCYLPKKYDDDAVTANENLSARLPYIFASSRFAHYIKCMVRDWISRNMTRDQLEFELNKWVNHYVHGNPVGAPEEALARHPLKKARVTVEEDPRNPGYYRGHFEFVPHFQLEGMDVSISMVSQLENRK